MSYKKDSNLPGPGDIPAPNFNGNPLYHCYGCGDEIYEGDIYYDLLEGDYCEQCAMNFKKVARE